MKKWWLSLALVPLAGVCHAGEAGRVSELRQAPINTILLSAEESSVTTFSNVLDRPIHASSGHLLLVFSPSEHAEFQNGELIRYMSVEDEKTVPVVQLVPPVLPHISANTEGNRLSLSTVLDQQHKITRLHGISCSITYDKDKKEYRIISKKQ